VGFRIFIVLIHQLGMSCNFTQHAVCYSIEEFNKIIHCDKYEILHIFFPVPNYCAIIHYRYKPEFICENIGDTNIVLAFVSTCVSKLSRSLVTAYWLFKLDFVFQMYVMVTVKCLVKCDSG
jgi:hypothetical protein